MRQQIKVKNTKSTKGYRKVSVQFNLFIDDRLRLNHKPSSHTRIREWIKSCIVGEYSPAEFGKLTSLEVNNVDT